jgi:hypothetical protein
MGYMTYCDLCEMDRSYCVHGLGERRQAASGSASTLLISPRYVAHFPGCPHKGNVPDLSRWAEVNAQSAWQRLGNGEELRATGGSRLDLIAKTRCQDCVDHGPW